MVNQITNYYCTCQVQVTHPLLLFRVPFHPCPDLLVLDLNLVQTGSSCAGCRLAYRLSTFTFPVHRFQFLILAKCLIRKYEQLTINRSTTVDLELERQRRMIATRWFAVQWRS